MRIARFGQPGQERPAIIGNDGIRRDCSAWVSDWTAASTRIKRDVTSDLDKLYKVHTTSPSMNCDLFTLEILAAQPGLLKKAAVKLDWAALLANDLTGSRNSVVV